jgi:hypothetical protein
MTNMLRNWKTSLSGVVAFLFACPAFVSAFQAWSNHQAIDWRSVVFGIAMFAVSSGLLAAKDSTTHSTAEEVQAASKP